MRPTSSEAYASIESDSAQMRYRVLREIKRRGEQGATCDEIERALRMIHQTCSARVRELFLRSEIEDSGRKRETPRGRRAIVWRVKT
jgi:hypothetical protein